eukprot:g1874.t1
MVLSPALQVSDEAMKEYVHALAQKGGMNPNTASMPTLLRDAGLAAASASSKGKGSYRTKGSRVRDEYQEPPEPDCIREWGSAKELPERELEAQYWRSERRKRKREGKPIKFGGAKLENMDRTMPVPCPDGRRNCAAKDYDIDVNVLLPFSGDCIKLTVDPELPVSAPRTPRDLKGNTLKQGIEGYVPGKRDSSPSLKNRLADLTGLKGRDIRLLHVQAKSYFCGNKDIASYGIQHGQTIDLVPHKEKTETEWRASLPPLKTRLKNNKYLPSLSSSLKKATVKDREPSKTLRDFAKTQRCKDPHHIMPRWTTAGKPLGDSASLAKDYAGDLSATIYYHDFQPVRERNCLPDACAKIREIFEKKRSYFERQSKCLSGPKKLAATLRVFMGKDLTADDVFKAWKDWHTQRMKDKSEFMRDAHGGGRRKGSTAHLDVRKQSQYARERHKGAMAETKLSSASLTRHSSLPDIHHTRRLW